MLAGYVAIGAIVSSRALLLVACDVRIGCSWLRGAAARSARLRAARMVEHARRDRRTLRRSARTRRSLAEHARANTAAHDADARQRPPRYYRRRLVHAGRVRQAEAHDRLLHRRADRADVLHGDADRHRASTSTPSATCTTSCTTCTDHEVHARRRPAPASPRPVPPLLPVPVAVLFSMLGLVHRRQHGDGVRVLGTGRHLLVLPDRLLHRAAQRQRPPPTRRSSSTASATSACSSA